MFEKILRASVSSGNTLQGDALDANWLFLLPDLDLDRVLCLGRPSAAALDTLSRVAKNVLQSETPAGLSPGFDLIYLANAKIKPDWPDLARLLAPKGSIYFEARGRNRSQTPGDLVVQQHIWLTPAFGSMQTAVPFTDSRTIQYFQKAGLYSSSINHQTVERLRHGWRKRRSLVPAPGGVASSNEGVTSRPKGMKARLRVALRKVRNAIIPWAERLENIVTRNPAVGPLLSRRGVLLSASCLVPHSLPAYLQQIALNNQVDLSAYRWGYAARGRYRSQKLLFFLFPPDAVKPAYIIKMVRDSAFNARLEREHQGLVRLQQNRVVPADTLPETVFFGYHHGLAVVGETIISGDSFDKRSQFDAACPYAQTAVQWLIELSARTVIMHSAANAADDFRALTDRFNQIYHPTSAQQQFLNQQVAVIRRQPPPLVFQHGDPGSWNLLVTAEDRVAFLDWENATSEGIPLWDLLYFLRSYCLGAGQRRGDYSNLAAFEHYFLEDSALSPFILSSVQRYCQQVPLAPKLVQSLFYLCWVFWAVKQAAMVEPERLATAHYWQLLKLCIERSDSPILARIFSQPVPAKG